MTKEGRIHKDEVQEKLFDVMNKVNAYQDQNIRDKGMPVYLHNGIRESIVRERVDKY